MGDKSAIEWTEASWNPIAGCYDAGPGCANCYARAFAERWRGTKGHAFENGFDITVRERLLDQPLRWKRPRRIFVNSMSDLFLKELVEPKPGGPVPVDYLDRIFSVMERATQHTFQALTKRSSLMVRYVRRRYGDGAVPPHIWLGVTVENAKARSRLDHLASVNANVRFISFEPLLESVAPLDLSPFQWAIVGGESGPKARPIEGEWVREIRDAALRDRTAFFFKQWGGFRPKSGGRTLDGREWSEYPESGTARLI